MIPVVSVGRILFEKYPALQGQVPHVFLCDLPTPLSPLAAIARESGARQVHAKRDDLSAPEYGGNKVRKLEFLLGAARARGCRETIDESTTNERKIRRLYDRTRRWLRSLDPAIKIGPLLAGQYSIRHEYYGGLYGETAASRAAIEYAQKELGLQLDPTYSGKAMAALLADAAAGRLRERSVLFWATCNSRKIALRPVAGELPRDFHPYILQTEA